MKYLERLGFAIIISSALFMILDRYVENELFQKIAGESEMLFWLGLLLWSLGTLMRQSKAKKESEVGKE